MTLLTFWAPPASSPVYHDYLWLLRVNLGCGVSGEFLSFVAGAYTFAMLASWPIFMPASWPLVFSRVMFPSAPLPTDLDFLLLERSLFNNYNF